MRLWFYLALAAGYLFLVGFAVSAVMAWLDRRRTRAHEAPARDRCNQERAAAILAYYYHVPACNCALILGGAVLSVDARCACWTRRMVAIELARKQNEPGAHPARSAPTVN